MGHYSVYIGPYVRCNYGEKNIDQSKLADKFKDRLTPIGLEQERRFDIWIPNVRMDGIKTRDFENFMGEEEIKEGTQAKETAVFVLGFARELKVIAASYGTDNVSVRWGVCGDWN